MTQLHPKVGEEIGYSRYHQWGTLVAHGFSKVAKINHHGHIILENGKVFDRHGRERNVQYGGLRLVEPNRLRDELQHISLQRARSVAARELMDLLEARRCVDFRPTSDETKARMIELVNQL